MQASSSTIVPHYADSATVAPLTRLSPVSHSATYASDPRPGPRCELRSAVHDCQRPGNHSSAPTFTTATATTTTATATTTTATSFTDTDSSKTSTSSNGGSLTSGGSSSRSLFDSVNALLAAPRDSAATTASTTLSVPSTTGSTAGTSSSVHSSSGGYSTAGTVGSSVTSGSTCTAASLNDTSTSTRNDSSNNSRHIGNNKHRTSQHSGSNRSGSHGKDSAASVMEEVLYDLLVEVLELVGIYSDGRLRSFAVNLAALSCSAEDSLAHAIIYIWRVHKTNPLLRINRDDVGYALFTAALNLAWKVDYDISYSNRSWCDMAADAGHTFELSRINAMETELLALIDYNIFISDADYARVLAACSNEASLRSCPSSGGSDASCGGTGPSRRSRSYTNNTSPNNTAATATPRVTVSDYDYYSDYAYSEGDYYSDYYSTGDEDGAEQAGAPVTVTCDSRQRSSARAPRTGKQQANPNLPRGRRTLGKRLLRPLSDPILSAWNGGGTGSRFGGELSSSDESDDELPPTAFSDSELSSLANTREWFGLSSSRDSAAGQQREIQSAR